VSGQHTAQPVCWTDGDESWHGDRSWRVWVYGRLHGPVSHRVYGIYQCLGRVGGHLFASP
jgi:hypothetical protein